MVVLSGVVSDSNPADVCVSFAGAASGSTGCDSNGNFSYTTSSANLGKVHAVAVDGAGLSSGPAFGRITVPPPIVSLSITYGSQRTVTLSGQVTDLDASSLSVTFTGVASGSVAVNPDGIFTLTTTATGLGTIQASTTDLWGQASNTAQVTVSALPPSITSFTATCLGGNLWTLSGTVTDQTSPAGLSVQFGGLSGVTGQTATVGANGAFSLTVQIPSGVSGTVTAEATDWWGLQSNTALASA
jgi:large repetitive protein